MKLFKCGFTKKLRDYCARIDHADELYENALKVIDDFKIDRAGDVFIETERFREKLHEYNLALMACYHYCFGAALEMRRDKESLEEYALEHSSKKCAAVIATLEEYLEAIKTIQYPCGIRMAEVRECRKVTEPMKEQLDMSKLVTLLEKIQR